MVVTKLDIGVQVTLIPREVEILREILRNHQSEFANVPVYEAEVTLAHELETKLGECE
jgi:hypothetical protein